MRDEAWAVALGLCVAACGARTGLEIDPPVVAADAGRPCRDDRSGARLDLLFVIDSSRSMDEEQGVLAATLPLFVRTLTRGDLDDDGVPDFPAATDVHAAVVTTDMGFVFARDGELHPGGCGVGHVPFGDDGELARVDPALPGCAPYGGDSILSHTEGAPLEPFAEALSCAARVGTDGCGEEQPFEAMLKALTPASASLRFLGATRGHGDGVNAGFLREDSVLAVVVLSDEDDRSFENADFLALDDPRRRVEGDDWLHPIARYADGLTALRARPSQLVFAAIVGVPEDLSGPIDTPGEARAILDDPRMARVYDPDERSLLRPVCASADGRASPARRLVELAGELPGRAAVHSICSDDFRPAIRVIAERVAEAIETTTCADGG